MIELNKRDCPSVGSWAHGVVSTCPFPASHAPMRRLRVNMRCIQAMVGGALQLLPAKRFSRLPPGAGVRRHISSAPSWLAPQHAVAVGLTASRHVSEPKAASQSSHKLAPNHHKRHAMVIRWLSPLSVLVLNVPPSCAAMHAALQGWMASGCRIAN